MPLIAFAIAQGFTAEVTAVTGDCADASGVLAAYRRDSHSSPEELHFYFHFLVATYAFSCRFRTVPMMTC